MAENLDLAARRSLQPGQVVEAVIAGRLAPLRAAVEVAKSNGVVVLTDGTPVGLRDELRMVGAELRPTPSRADFAPEDQEHGPADGESGEDGGSDGDGEGPAAGGKGTEGTQGQSAADAGRRRSRGGRRGVPQDVQDARRQALDWYAAAKATLRGRSAPALAAMLEQHPGLAEACGVPALGVVQLDFWRAGFGLRSRRSPTKRPGPAAGGKGTKGTQGTDGSAAGLPAAAPDGNAELRARCEALGEEVARLTADCGRYSERVTRLDDALRVAQTELAAARQVTARPAAEPALVAVDERMALLAAGRAAFCALSARVVEIAEAVEVARRYPWALRVLRGAQNGTDGTQGTNEGAAAAQEPKGGAR